MPEALIEGRVSLVAYGEKSVLDPERAQRVFAQVGSCDFHRPTGEIFPVEEDSPLLLLGNGGARGRAQQDAERADGGSLETSIDQIVESC